MDDVFTSPLKLTVQGTLSIYNDYTHDGHTSPTDTNDYYGRPNNVKSPPSVSWRQKGFQWVTLLQCVMLTTMVFITPSVHARKRQDILRSLLNNTAQNQYDSSIPPHFDEDVPTNISVQIYVLSFDSVTESTMVNSVATTSYLKYEDDEPSPPSSDYASAADRLFSLHTADSPNHLPYSRPPAFGSKSKSESGSFQELHRGFEFSVSIFLRQNWTDPRLRWTDPEVTDRLEVDPKMMNQVWVPDLYFINEREAIMHEVTVANKLLHIDQNGTILHSMRISMTLSCDMHLSRYPHDEQVCSICLGSYGFSKENVVFNWVDEAVIMRPDMTLPRFQVNFQDVTDCDYLFTEDGSMILGDYSCIQANFHLRREFGYYIAQVYVPSVLIVMLSWVSFWIDIEATPARVSLGLLTVLTMTTQSTGEKAALPRVSYIKAIDVWMSMCLFFVFAALLEFAYVNVQSRVEKRRRDLNQCSPTNEGPRINSIEKEVKVHQRPSLIQAACSTVDSDNLHKARSTDKISRVAFPAAFAIFNSIYWIYYR